jgi:hypothetical protein
MSSKSNNKQELPQTTNSISQQLAQQIEAAAECTYCLCVDIFVLKRKMSSDTEIIDIIFFLFSS